MGFKIIYDQIRSETISNQLNQQINDVNGLADKHDLKYRFKYLSDQEMYPGRLVLGRKEQFDAGTYESCLAQGAPEALCVMRSINRYLCAEFGE